MDQLFVISKKLPIHHLRFKVGWFIVYIGDGDLVGLSFRHPKYFLYFPLNHYSIVF